MIVMLGLGSRQILTPMMKYVGSPPVTIVTPHSDDEKQDYFNGETDAIREENDRINYETVNKGALGVHNTIRTVSGVRGTEVRNLCRCRTLLNTEDMLGHNQQGRASSRTERNQSRNRIDHDFPRASIEHLRAYAVDVQCLFSRKPRH